MAAVIPIHHSALPSSGPVLQGKERNQCKDKSPEPIHEGTESHSGMSAGRGSGAWCFSEHKSNQWLPITLKLKGNKSFVVMTLEVRKAKHLRLAGQ